MEAFVPEKRKFERFPGKEGEMAGILSSDKTRYTELLNIRDMSKGGLSLECSHPLGQEASAGFLDILGLAYPHTLIRTVPFRVVYNRKIEPKYPAAGTDRCGLEFYGLSPSQSSELDLFVQNHAA